MTNIDFLMGFGGYSEANISHKENLISSVFSLLNLVFLVSITSCVGYSATIGPENPGFEVSAQEDPAQWQKPPLTWPIYDRSMEGPRSGTAAIKCSLNDYYSQTFSASEERIYSFVYWIRGDTGNELSVFRIEWMNPFGSVIRVKDRYVTSSADYQYDAFSLLAPVGTSSARITLRPVQGWIWYDDVAIINDVLDNTGMEDADQDNNPDSWEKTGSVVTVPTGGYGDNGGATILGVGGSINQAVSELPYTHTVVSVFARCDSPNSSIELGIFWEDANGEQVSAVTQEFICSSGYNLFHLEGPPPSETVLAQIHLTNKSVQGSIFVDELTYGWLAVKPDPFSPNGDGVRDEAIINASYSGVRSAGFTVQDENGIVFTGPVKEASGPLSWSWNGRNSQGMGLPEGQYQILLDYYLSSGTVLTASLPVELLSPVYLDPGGTIPGDLVRFVWGSGSMEVYRNRRNLELLKSHGITDILLIVFWSPEEVQEILDLAESVGLKIIFQPWDLIYLDLLLRGDFETLPEEDVYTELVRRYGGILHHPALRGFLSVDEPFLEQAEDARMVHQMLRDLAPDKFIYLNLASDPEQVSGIIQPDVISSSLYPVWRHLHPGNFVGYESFMDKIKSLANLQGVDFWMITQGFNDVGTARMAWPSESRLLVNLALARSAKGIGYFFFANPFSRLSTGMIDYEGQETRLFRDIGFNNRRLELLSPIVMDLESTNPFNVSVSTGKITSLMDSNNIPVLLIINDDCRRSRSISVTFNGSLPSQLVDGLSGSLLPFYADSAGVHFDLILAPGDSRYVRIMP